MCLSFPGLLRSSRLIVARYRAGAAHRKYSGPRHHREDIALPRRQAHLEVRP